VSGQICLNSLEIGAILPGLEHIVNGVANRRTHPGWNFYEELRSSRQIYQNRLFAHEMHEHVLTCRNKLKSISRSRKVRLNAFEIAAAALALRWILKQRLAPAEVINTEAVAALPRKLELHRKRAKRSGMRLLGSDEYRIVATRWRLFAQWIRLKILIPPSRIKLGFHGVRALKLEQREKMLQLVREVAVDSTPEVDVRRWVELARWEIWKGRHRKTLREFLSDYPKAKLFLADFIMKRADVRVLRAEFIPGSIRASLSGYDFKGALSRLPGDTHAETVPSHKLPAPVLLAPDHRLNAAGPPAPVPIPEPSSVDLSHPQMAVSKQDLVSLLHAWFVDEVEPGYYQDVADEIRHQVWCFSQNHQISVTSTIARDIIEQSRPVYAIAHASSPELTAYFAGWPKWLLALNSDPLVVHDAVGSGMLAARTYVGSLTPLTRQRKITEIHRRYFS
jgi:hypothetical protein